MNLNTKDQAYIFDLVDRLLSAQAIAGVKPEILSAYTSFPF